MPNFPEQPGAAPGVDYDNPEHYPDPVIENWQPEVYQPAKRTKASSRAHGVAEGEEFTDTEAITQARIDGPLVDADLAVGDGEPKPKRTRKATKAKE